MTLPSLDLQAQAQAQARWDQLTKPPGSLGRLEQVGTRVAAMTGQPVPSFKRKVIFTIAADHGVVAEGVAAYPQAVTQQMVANFLAGGAAINVLASHVEAEVVVADAGVAADLSDLEQLVSCKVRRGTGNIAREPAMTLEEAEKIIEAGKQLFEQTYQKQPIDLVGLGDMGIGNTTASAALTAWLTGRSPQEVTGRGTGINDQQLSHKIQVIEQALDRHHPDLNQPVEGLALLGGLEIGCLVGVALAAASHRVPVVLDGFITTAAALVATQLESELPQYLIASHQSVEPGHQIQLKVLGLEPILDLDLRLGEGTGAALGMGLVEASVKLLGQMATFAQAGVSTQA